MQWITAEPHHVGQLARFWNKPRDGREPFYYYGILGEWASGETRRPRVDGTVSTLFDFAEIQTAKITEQHSLTTWSQVAFQLAESIELQYGKETKRDPMTVAGAFINNGLVLLRVAGEDLARAEKHREQAGE